MKIIPGTHLLCNLILKVGHLLEVEAYFAYAK